VSKKKNNSFVTGPEHNFLGLDSSQTSYARSRVVVLPLPYEATTSYGAGTRFGAEAIINASAQVELYDSHSECEASQHLGIHTAPPLFPNFSSPEAMIDQIAGCASTMHKDDKFVLGLGGEHTVTVGLLRAAARKTPDICLLQIDAHADLRNSYEGTSFSHACAARRALEELGCRSAKGKSTPQLIQVGIRNISEQGDRFRKRCGKKIKTFWADDIHSDQNQSWLDEISELVADRNIYLSLDLDGLDPSIMPATGTPEPGGLLWSQITALIERVALAGNIISADLVELAPQPGNHAPDFLAARLAYYILQQI
jgi:N1-aminopropylagmatine ureohydrolase